MTASGPSTVLLLAGSRGVADPVATAAGVPHKALAPLRGRPMIAHVLAALRDLPELRRIVLVCDDPHLLRTAEAVARAETDGVLVMAAAAASPSRSILDCLDRGDLAPPALVTTADAPLLTPAFVHAFWAAVPAGADIAAAVTAGAGIRARFPGSRRTFLRFSDGDYCGCNLFALATPEARRVVALWRRLEDHRKQPLKMAALLGPTVILRYLLRRLSLQAAAAHVSRRAGVGAAIVPIPFPEAAVDVDKPGDLAVAEAVLAERGCPAAPA